MQMSGTRSVSAKIQCPLLETTPKQVNDAKQVSEGQVQRARVLPLGVKSVQVSQTAASAKTTKQESRALATQQGLYLGQVSVTEGADLLRLLEANRPYISKHTLSCLDELMPHYTVVRTKAHQIVGAVAAMPVGEALVEIRGLAVAGDFRRLKLGSWLLENAVQTADARGERLVCVTRAQRFFSKFDFKPCTPFWRFPADIALARASQRAALTATQDVRLAMCRPSKSA